MRVAICEDEIAMHERLTAIIKDWASARSVAVDIQCYESAEEFLFKWEELSFDLVILDIQMKKMSGIELSAYIRQYDKTMLIVFLTSFSQYAVDSYEVDALHYLVKPVSSVKLIAVLDKAYKIISSRKNSVLIVQNGEGKVKLTYDSIYYISMSANTARIVTGTVTHELRKPAKSLIEQLPDYFIRCHRTYIVNLYKTDCVYDKSLLLSNGQSLPVSRNNTKQVKTAFARLYMG